MVSQSVILVREEQRDRKRGERALRVDIVQFMPLTKRKAIYAANKNSSTSALCIASHKDNERLPLHLDKRVEEQKDQNDIVTLCEHNGKFNAISVVKQRVLRSSCVL